MVTVKIIKKRNGKLARKEALLFYLFISPWIVGFTLFTLTPIASSLIYSFKRIVILDLATGGGKNVGIENFTRILKDNDVLWIAIKNTFFYAFVRVFLGLCVSFLFAALLNQNIRGKKLFRLFIYVPAIIPIVGSALVWKGLFSEQFSFFSYMLSKIGIHYNDWMGNNAMWSVILMSVWCGIGPTMIILLAALQTVPSELTEAAEIDGAGVLQRYFHITLPTISSTIFYVLITGFIGTLQAYAEFDLVTGGGPGYKTTTMSMLVINTMRNDNYGLGYSCALAWVVCVIVMLFTLLFFKLSKGKIFYSEGD